MIEFIIQTILRNDATRELLIFELYNFFLGNRYILHNLQQILFYPSHFPHVIMSKTSRNLTERISFSKSSNDALYVHTGS